jgi:hypothetical protein
MKPERAHGFEFKYYAPGIPFATQLPKEVKSLAEGRAIVSFKGLNDERRCGLAAAVLGAVFESCSAHESERPRLLVVMDEAQLFTRKRVDEAAQAAAAQSERAIDRIAREGRKFGIVLALVTQTAMTFSRDLASIRQMATTRFFLRNSDREIAYAADIVGDGRSLVQLRTGVALAHNASWGTARIRVRPPWSKVFELGEAELRRLIGSDGKVCGVLTSAAQALLRVIKENGASADQPLNMSRAAQFAGITSKRKLDELIQELENANAIRTKQLIERGRPRIIELIGNVPV